MKNDKKLNTTKMPDYKKKQILDEMKINNVDHQTSTYYDDLLKRHKRLSEYIKKNYTQ